MAEKKNQRVEEKVQFVYRKKSIFCWIFLMIFLGFFGGFWGLLLLGWVGFGYGGRWGGVEPVRSQVTSQV
jgi:hypothetical protein